MSNFEKTNAYRSGLLCFFFFFEALTLYGNGYVLLYLFGFQETYTSMRPDLGVHLITSTGIRFGLVW